MIRGILFDLDGTLLDSMWIWDNVGRDFLQNHHVEVPENLNEILKVLSFAQSSQYFVENFGLPCTPKEVSAEINAMVADQYRSTIPSKPYAGDFLKSMSARGISMCVATATDQPLATSALERLGFLPYLSFVLTCQDVGYGKDTPHIYDEASKKLGLQKQEIIVVEDALHCVQTAKQAGYRVAGIYDHAARQDAEKIRTLSDWYFENFQEMEQILFAGQ